MLPSSNPRRIKSTPRRNHKPMNWWEIGILVGVIYISMFFTYQVIKNIITYIREHKIVTSSIQHELDFYKEQYDYLTEENRKLKKSSY